MALLNACDGLILQYSDYHAPVLCLPFRSSVSADLFALTHSSRGDQVGEGDFALLDQDVFGGVGNIIKNEVLFRIRVHPESKIGALPPRKLTQLIDEARNYSFDFLKWKKAFELRKHWLAHTKKTCPRCHIPFIKVQHLGKRERRAFFCDNCQVLYLPEKKPHSHIVRAIPRRTL